MNGKKITLTLGTVSSSSDMDAPKDMPNGENTQGNAPSKPKGNASSKSKDDDITKNLDSKKDMFSKNKQPGVKAQGGGIGKSFISGGSTAVLTVNDRSIIKKEKDKNTKDAKLSGIKKDQVLLITFDSNVKIIKITITDIATNNSGSRTETNGTAATTFKANAMKGVKSHYNSTHTDENALRVQNGANVKLSGITLTKSGDSSNSENSDFYGMNAGALVRDKATLTITNANITTNAKGGNGVFAYGKGSNLNIRNAKIMTSQNNSGGIDLTGGATINAENLDISTKGASAAALRTDRGGGIMKVNKGKYLTNGTGSPAIYSTAQVSVNNAKLTANKSEAIVIEGKNSVNLSNCIVTGNMAGTYGVNSSENIHNVMIYQSMSGDASVGSGNFTMTNGSLISKNGDTFYVTNTTSKVNLTNVSIKNANGNLLSVMGNDASRGWGKAGSNGGICDFNVSNQKLDGKIVVDKISTLNLTINKNSSFNGTINPRKQAGNVSVSLDSTSKWSLTGNAYITKFNGSVNSIQTNGFHVYVNGTLLK